jgi:PAS domain S-box-containing protein
MATVARLPLIYFEKLLENSPDIVVAVDRRGTIIFYNDGARSILGYTPEEVLGEHVARLYPNLEEGRKVMLAMRAGYDGVHGQVRNFETVFVTKSGERFPVAISGSIIYDETRTAMGSIGFAKDLREIRRHDQLMTLAEVAVSLAHEVNNPLEVIVNNLQLVEQHVARVSSDDDFIVESERLESIHTAVQRIQTILSQLNEMAHGGEYRTTEYVRGAQMTDLRQRFRGATTAQACPDPALAGIRILIIDDDLGVCQSLRDLLTQEGCEVIVATRGREGLRRLDEHQFDLVLSDVVMPELDGYDVFMEAKEKHPDVPVVLMTAFQFDKDHVIKRSKIEGLKDVVYKKPIDPPRLRELIKRHARRRPT